MVYTVTQLPERDQVRPGRGIRYGIRMVYTTAQVPERDQVRPGRLPERNQVTSGKGEGQGRRGGVYWRVYRTRSNKEIFNQKNNPMTSLAKNM
eukprot:4642039-Pyramimonas_sp.AAC.1